MLPLFEMSLRDFKQLSRTPPKDVCALKLSRDPLSRVSSTMGVPFHFALSDDALLLNSMTSKVLDGSLVCPPSIVGALNGSTVFPSLGKEFLAVFDGGLLEDECRSGFPLDSGPVVDVAERPGSVGLYPISVKVSPLMDGE